MIADEDNRREMGIAVEDESGDIGDPVSRPVDIDREVLSCPIGDIDEADLLRMASFDGIVIEALCFIAISLIEAEIFAVIGKCDDLLMAVTVIIIIAIVKDFLGDIPRQLPEDFLE